MFHHHAKEGPHPSPEDPLPTEWALADTGYTTPFSILSNAPNSAGTWFRKSMLIILFLSCCYYFLTGTRDWTQIKHRHYDWSRYGGAQSADRRSAASTFAIIMPHTVTRPIESAIMIQEECLAWRNGSEYMTGYKENIPPDNYHSRWVFLQSHA